VLEQQQSKGLTNGFGNLLLQRRNFLPRVVDSVSVAYNTSIVPICGGPRRCLGLEGLRAALGGSDDQKAHF